ncbi:MAG: hypothetical protein ISS84_00620 [Candidatus Pacebacteria bacterium]|nr:hypothetical protein [Candidatus Paceibacterota bacterium]
MAYVLGFTFADGNIHYSALSWDLKDDIELLKSINRAMKSNYPVKKRKNSFRLRISNPIIFQDIQKLGIIPNKTKTCQFPSIPVIFLRDFIRGFLDGDGWIITKRKKMEISVGLSNGSSEFLKELVKKLNAFLSLTTNNFRSRKKITKKGNVSITYTIEWYSQNAFKIIKFLYDDLRKNDLFLERKYNKQMEAREIYEKISSGGKKYREIEKRYKLPMQKLLQELLAEKKYTEREIAQKLGVHSSSIHRWLEKTKIKLLKRKIKKIIVKECPICHKQFEQYKYPKKYCSERCRIQARNTGKFIKCAICKKEIYRPKWWFKINNTPICSRECIKKWRHIRAENNLIRHSKKTGRFISLRSK